MSKRRQPRKLLQTKAISLAVASCFAASLHTIALANPNGFSVVNGQVTFNYNGNTLTITNTPGSIINWQSFSIGAGELTRFLQQSASSAVLNRVVGVDPSVILGALQSNGRVFLINPNGIMFGANAQVDVAGLVASTLNLSNGDFLAGRLRFTETPGAGGIVNQGGITTPNGGQVYLIAPNVKNSGIITSPQGEIILAAGRSVEIVDAGTPSLRVQVTAPDNEVVNLGQLIASSGKIGIFGGLIKNSGTIKADGVVVGKNGEILLKATKTVALDKGSSITASGPTAGKISIESESGTVAVAGTVEANATQGKGGTISIAGQQGVSVESTARISANGLEGGAVSLTSSAGSVNIAAPVTANASLGRAGSVVASAANVITVAAGGNLSAAGGQSGGSVVAQGKGGVVIESGATLQAGGAAGGSVIAQADEGSVLLQGTVDVTGSEASGGSATITARDDITLDLGSRILAGGGLGGEVRAQSTEGALYSSGLIDAQGSQGPGGSVYLLAPRVALLRRSLIDVSGDAGGGTILIGGDFQGSNLEIPNAFRTYVDPDAMLRANAITAGDGGKVIVWSDDATRFYGNISARGGAVGGDGGFVEVSGKKWLDFGGLVNTSAPNGSSGTLLLDPSDVFISDSGEAFAGGNFASGLFGGATGPATILWSTIDTQLNGGNVVITTSGSGGSGDITLSAGTAVSYNRATSLTLLAHNQIIVNRSVTNTGTGDFNMYAGWDGNAVAPGVTAGATHDITFSRGVSTGGAMTLKAGDGINVIAGTNNITLDSAGLQTIVAGGTLLVQGGTDVRARIRSAGGQVISAANINLIGGTGSLATGAAEIDQTGAGASQLITIAGGNLSLTGGLTGINNFARIRNQGVSQQIVFSSPGAMTLTGGSGTSGNFVTVQALTGTQNISGLPSITVDGGDIGGAFEDGNYAHITANVGAQTISAGNVTIRAGDGGIDNNAAIRGPDQTIAVNGDLVITGGGSSKAGSLTNGAGARIGGLGGSTPTSTDLDLTVTGNVTLTGGTAMEDGTGAAIGSSFVGGQTVNIVMNVAGDITLNAGTGASGARIGIPLADISVGTVSIAANSITLGSNGAGGGKTLMRSGGNLSVDAVGDIFVYGTVKAGQDLSIAATDLYVGNSVMTSAALVQAGRDLTVDLTGNMIVRGGTATAGGSIDATSRVLAGRHANINANELYVWAGNAGGGGVNDASALISAIGDITLVIGGYGVEVRGGTAAITPTGGNYDFTATADAGLTAGGNMTLTLAGGSLLVVGGTADAEAHSGSATATASASAALTAGSALNLNVPGGIHIGAGHATALAFQYGSYFSQLSGNNTASAVADSTVSGGSGATITIVGGGGLTVAGGSADASAYKATCCTGSHVLSGTNDATANARVTVSGGTGNLTLNLGDGELRIGGNHAHANAYDFASGGNTHSLTGDNTANAAANISLVAGNRLSIAGTSVSSMVVGIDGGELFGQRPLAHAAAYKKTASNALLDGTNSATAQANLTLEAAGVGGMDVTVGSLQVRGAQTFAEAYHSADGGSGNALRGNNLALANGEVSFKATHNGGNLTLSLTGGMTVTGGTTSNSSGLATRAFKHVLNGENHDLFEGNNSAESISEVRFTAGNNLSVSAASLSVDSGGGANATANKTVVGYKGVNNVLGGTNTASATAETRFIGGSNLTLDLGIGGGALTVYGTRADAEAFHLASGGSDGPFSSNILSGDNEAGAYGSTSLYAGGNLIINAGSVSISGRSAQASAYKRVAGSFSTAESNYVPAGTNIGTASSTLAVTAGAITLDIGTGGVQVGGGSADAQAKHDVTFANGTIFGGDNLATATSSITLAAITGGLTVRSGGMDVYANDADATAYKSIQHGTGNSQTTGQNVATATSSVDVIGTSVTLDLGAGQLYVSGSNADARAYHSLYGSNVSNNNMGGNNAATADSILSITATAGPLTVNAAGGMYVYGDSADARAYKSLYTYNGGSTNTQGGNNIATANSGVTLSAPSLAINLGTGDLYINAGNVESSAYMHHGSGTGSTMAGDHVANAAASINLEATGGALTVTAHNISFGDGGEGYARASKSVYGNSADVSGTLGATSNLNLTVSASGALTLNAAGNVSIGNSSSYYYYGENARAESYHEVGGDGHGVSGIHTATMNRGITLNAGGAVAVNAASLEIFVDGGEGGGDAARALGYMFASGTNNRIGGVAGVASNAATATSILSVSGNGVALDLGSGHLAIGGGGAVAEASQSVQSNAGSNIIDGANSASATGNIVVGAGAGALTVNAGSVAIQGNGADAWAYKTVFGSYLTVNNTLAGNTTATAVGNVSLSGGSITIDAGEGFTIGGNSANASAYQDIPGTVGSNVSGNQLADATSNITLTATGGLTVSGAGMAIFGAEAGASAYKNSYGSGNTLSGGQVATANSNISLSGSAVSLQLGGEPLNIYGSSASAEAYHIVNGGTGNVLGGDHTATANSNITLSASGAFTVNAGGMSIFGDDATGSAYKRIAGVNQTVSGNNTATGNSNISLTGGSLALNLGTGSLTLRGSDGEAHAYHYGSGSMHNISGAHNAAGNSKIDLRATGGALDIIAGGGILISISDGAQASASKSVSGNSNSLSGNNNATASSNITLSGSTVTLDLGAGGLAIVGSNGISQADATHNVDSGNLNILTGNHAAAADGNVAINATGGALVVNAGSVILSLRGGEQSSSSSSQLAAAKRVGVGNSNSLSGNNTENVNSNISLGGNGLALNLGTGVMMVRGAAAVAPAHAYVNNGVDNVLSGDQSKTVNTDITLSANSGTLTLQAGSLNISSNYANASAYKLVSVGDNNQILGNNTATASSLIKFSGDNVNVMLSGGLGILGSYVGATVNNHVYAGNNNTLNGNNTAKASANVIFSAANALTVQALGGADISASAAYANAYNSIGGSPMGVGNSLAGVNNAVADANVRLSADGSVTLNTGAMGLVLGADYAQAHATTTGAPGNTVTTANTSTAHSNVLVSSAGNMSVTAGTLTVQGGNPHASGSNLVSNAAEANANAGLFALGAKTVNVAGAVSLIGGTSVVQTGAGAEADAFAMIDPGSLALSAGGLILTPNDGGVVISAVGPMTFTINNVVTPVAAYALPGVIIGQSTLTSVEGPNTINITDRFGLPNGFLPNSPIIVDIAQVSPSGIVFWDGGASTFNWLDALNWSTDLLPGVTQDVNIGTLASPVILTGVASIRSLLSSAGITLSGPGAALTIANGASINNTLTISGGTLTANAGITIGNLVLSSGALNGFGDLRVTSGFSHTGGSIGTGFALIGITQATGNLAVVNPLAATTVNLTATAGDIAESGAGAIMSTNSTLTASGNVLMAGANDFGNVGVSSTGGNATLNDINAVGLNASSVSGSMGVTAAGNISINGAITGGSVALTSTGGGIFDPAGAYVTGNTITLNAHSGVGFFDDVTPSNTRAVFVAPASSSGLSVTNTTSGDIVVTGGVASSGNDLIIGSGGASFSNTGTGGYFITANRDLIINSGAPNDGQVFFNALRDVNVAQAYTNNTGLGVILDAARDINIAANLTAGGAGGFLALVASGNVNLTDAVASSTQASVTVTGASLNVTSNLIPTALRAGTDMTIAVPGSVMVSGGSASNAYAEISNAGGSGGAMNITAGGNVVISGGTGLGAYAQIHGKPDVNLTLTGMTSEVQLNAGPTAEVDCVIATNCQYARIWADSPSTISIDFLQRLEGGYLVNGQAVVASPLSLSGFYVGPQGEELAAALGAGLRITYANGSSALPQTVVAALNSITDVIKNSTEFEADDQEASDDNSQSPKEKKKNEEKNKKVCS